MDSNCDKQNKHVIMVEGQEGDDLDSVSSSLDVSSNSISSTLSDFLDDATMTTESFSSSSSSPKQNSSPLYEMNSLRQQLPLKRALSKYFQGKSQSFTSLSNVRSLADLAKPENPYSKKLKSCTSHGGMSESQKTCTPENSSKIISEKSSTDVKKNNRRPGVPPQKPYSL